MANTNDTPTTQTTIRVFPIAAAALGILSLCGVVFAQMALTGSAERRAKEWEEIARRQGDALDNLMRADVRLKTASDQLRVACKL